MITNYLLIALTLVNFALIYWGTVKFFRVKGDFLTKDVRNLRIATVSTWICCLAGLFFFPSQELLATIGILLSLIASVLFLAAIKVSSKIGLTLVYSKDTPTGLLHEGPYRWVRHPFYTSYLLSYLGASLGSRMWLPYLCTAIMLTIYIRAAKIEEMKFQNSDLAREYDEYKAKVGAFFPKFF